jgi:hypothetical protein
MCQLDPDGRSLVSELIADRHDMPRLPLTEGDSGSLDEAKGEVRQDEAGSAVVVEGTSPIVEGQRGYVLDASALMRLVNGEPGAERVAVALPRSVISAANLAEVGAKRDDLGADAEMARSPLAPLHLVGGRFRRDCRLRSKSAAQAHAEPWPFLG